MHPKDCAYIYILLHRIGTYLPVSLDLRSAAASVSFPNQRHGITMTRQVLNDLHRLTRHPASF